jgi:hypothetical protein
MTGTGRQNNTSASTGPINGRPTSNSQQNITPVPNLVVTEEIVETNNGNDNWNTVSTNRRNPSQQSSNRQVVSNTQQQIKVCPHFAKGECRSHNLALRNARTNGGIAECKFGLHISEQERNSNEDISPCYAYLNSPYEHSPLTCIEINTKKGTPGLCYNCAHGGCRHGNCCVFRHDPNRRHEQQQRNEAKEIRSKYIIETDNYQNNRNNHNRNNTSTQSPADVIVNEEPVTTVVANNSECPTYLWGAKTKFEPIPIKQKEKAVITYDSLIEYDDDGYESVNLHRHLPELNINGLPSSESLNTFDTSSKKSTGSRNSRRSNKSKEIYEEFGPEYKYVDGLGITRSNSGYIFHSIESDDDTISTLSALKLGETISPCPSPMDVNAAMRASLRFTSLGSTDSLRKLSTPSPTIDMRLNKVLSSDSLRRINTPSPSSLKGKKLSLSERKKLEKKEKKEERQKKRDEINKNRIKEEDSDSSDSEYDSDSDSDSD